MSRTTGFIQWIQSSFDNEQEFRPSIPGEVPYAENFNLCYKRRESFLKGKQWYLFKVMPPSLSPEDAQRLAFERNQVVKGKTRFFKFIVDILVFIYVSENLIPHNILNYLANFHSVRKKFFGNVHEINFLLDTSTGDYIRPRKTGFINRRPLKKLIEDAQHNILDPYRHWLQTS